jgi:hypothetical protein
VGKDRLLSEEEVAAARERRLVGQKLQELEGNPLSAEDVAVEMFERERWSHERCRAYILGEKGRAGEGSSGAQASKLIQRSKRS